MSTEDKKEILTEATGKRDQEKKLDYLFIIPSHNEALILESSIFLLMGFLENGWKGNNSNWKLMIADNASRDKTIDIVKKLEKKFSGRLDLLSITRKGRGIALKQAVRKYQASYYLYIDADIPIDPNNIPAFLKLLENKNADITVGKRFGRRPLIRKLLTRIMFFFNRAILDLNVSSPQCGVKAFNAEAASLLRGDACKENGYFLDIEFLSLAGKHSLKIEEIKAEWIESRYKNRKSKVHLLKDSFGALASLFRIARRLDKVFWKDAVILLSLGAVFVGIYLAHFIVFRKYGFSIAHHFNSGRGEVQIFAFIFGLIYLATWFVFTRLVKIRTSSLLISCAILFLVISICFFTNPTRSQDAYWNLLLAKGFMKHGLNPYQTTPLNLVGDPWYRYATVWSFLPMTHGPVSVFLFALPSAATNSIGMALLMLKAEILVIFFLATILIWKVLAASGFSRQKSICLTALFMLNPFMLQNTIIDAHNDILLLIFVLLSYYLLLKNKYVGSILSLTLGILTKYALFILLPVPIIKLLNEKKSLSSKLYALAMSSVLALGLAIAVWFPFGFDSKNFNGLRNEMLLRGSNETSSVFAVILKESLRLSNGQLRTIGAITALLLASYLAYRKRYLLAYSAPLLFILLYATPWLNSWYFLWIYPLLLMLLPYSATVFLTVLLILNWDVFWPLHLTIFALFAFALFFSRKHVFGGISWINERFFKIVK